MLDKQSDECLYCDHTITARTFVTSLVRFQVHSFRHHPADVYRESEQVSPRIASLFALGLSLLALAVSAAVYAYDFELLWLAVSLYFGLGFLAMAVFRGYEAWLADEHKLTAADLDD